MFNSNVVCDGWHDIMKLVLLTRKLVYYYQWITSEILRGENGITEQRSEISTAQRKGK